MAATEKRSSFSTIKEHPIFCRIFCTLHTREDHFEMNFMVKTYKFAKSLVKIGTSNAPRPFLGPTPL